jgi:hypothetical protein
LVICFRELALTSYLGGAVSFVVWSDRLYYMRLLVGNPPKPYFVDIDTGSDLTWLQCDAPCQSCAEVGTLSSRCYPQFGTGLRLLSIYGLRGRPVLCAPC